MKKTFHGAHYKVILLSDWITTIRDTSKTTEKDFVTTSLMILGLGWDKLKVYNAKLMCMYVNNNNMWPDLQKHA